MSWKFLWYYYMHPFYRTWHRVKHVRWRQPQTFQELWDAGYVLVQESRVNGALQVMWLCECPPTERDLELLRNAPKNASELR